MAFLQKIKLCMKLSNEHRRLLLKQAHADHFLAQSLKELRGGIELLVYFLGIQRFALWRSANFAVRYIRQEKVVSE